MLVNKSKLWREHCNDYLALTKPRIVFLLLFTMIIAMVLASDSDFFPVNTFFVMIGAGALSAGGASALNQYFDRTLDATMARTKNRPLPTGRIQPINALLFGGALVAWSTLILIIWVNWFTVWLALFGVFYYVGIYTLLLKRNTTLNIILGGGAGAIPVLVGWVAITGRIEPQALLLFMIIFFWTPPHSWSLSLMLDNDYRKAKISMFSVVYESKMAGLHIVWYSLLLVLITLLLFPLGMQGAGYFFIAVILGVILLYYALQLLKITNSKTACQMFKFSTYYLALLFSTMMMDKFIANL